MILPQYTLNNLKVTQGHIEVTRVGTRRERGRLFVALRWNLSGE
jgi:hypothetical protein